MPDDSPGARIKHGVATFVGAASCAITACGVLYRFRDVIPAGSTNFPTGEVSVSVLCSTVVSARVTSVPSTSRWIVLGRCPVDVNICGRVSTSFTGRPHVRAACAASATCCHKNPFDPNAPPRNGALTRTLSASIPSIAATIFRVPCTHRVLSCSCSRSPSHTASVAEGSIGLWCTTGVRYSASNRFTVSPGRPRELCSFSSVFVAK